MKLGEATRSIRRLVVSEITDDRKLDFASKLGIFELIKSIRGISEGCRGAVMALERNCLKRKLILNRSDEQHVHPI